MDWAWGIRGWMDKAMVAWDCGEDAVIPTKPGQASR